VLVVSSGYLIVDRFASLPIIASAQCLDIHVGPGREPINLPGGRLAKVRYAPMATKFCNAAE